MKLAIQIEMDNAAFDGDENGSEAATILRGLAANIEGVGLCAKDHGTLYDHNGNRTGAWSVSGRKPR
jgi:hypothetical protein